ncbi:MAG TPA: serine hydrolase [Oligoflexus sp.]|uniref:serine hydrolase domain-containing protein n=1 Tax=Oligoflexus sp. TaxID=1971216 RepID=UPI002D7E5A8D|nr:serine hydrolase [Oligoflexus sp.]HET9238889.1 serine hydrolase [Oligoflexus sp.]
MASPELELKNLLQAERQQGYFTAAYVESGKLDQAQPALQYFTGPDARIFDLASLTKALVTGPLVHITLKAENLDVKAPLAAWAPRDISLPASLLQLTTDEVLGHVSGLPAWWNFWMRHLDERQKPTRADALGLMEKVLNRIPFGSEKKDLYSDVGYILLGYLLEKKAKKSLKPWLSEAVSEPFGYAPDLNLPKESYIPTGFCKIRERELRGEVHDENCAAFGGISGHAGLFGSGPSVSQYLKALLRDSMGVQYFEANDKVRRDTQREGLLGFRRGNGVSAALFANGNSMGHLGFTGTAFWLEWSSKKYGIFLSNRVISGRVSPRITDIRRKVFQLLDASLGP